MVDFARANAPRTFIHARCVVTGELVNLGPGSLVFLDHGPGELARAASLLPGEIVWTAQGRCVRAIGAKRTPTQHEAQHGLADIECGLAS